MFLYGLGGFIGGMILGAVINMILLKGVPAAEWRKDRNLKLKYGALNWAVGFLGMAVMIYLSRYF